MIKHFKIKLTSINAKFNNLSKYVAVTAKLGLMEEKSHFQFFYILL